MAARLREKYDSELLSKLAELCGRKNVMSLPRLKKIVINMGVGSATQEKKDLQDASEALGLIAGQKPVLTKARKSIANFRLREGQAIGCNAKAFDGRGNYSLGLTEYGVFPELNADKFTRTQGMNIVFVTSTDDDHEGRELLRMFGMPFKDQKKDAA